MKSRLLTSDKSKVLSVWDARTRNRDDGAIEYYYEPSENKAVVLSQIQGIEVFTLEMENHSYSVALFTAVLDKPLKFMPSPPAGNG